MIRRILAVAATAGTMLATTTPAAQAATHDDDCHLTDYTGRGSASLCWPITPGRPIIIEGPPHVWQMRTYAKRLDTALPGLDVRTGSCTTVPGSFCLRVVKANKGQTYQGFMEFARSANPDGTWRVDGGTITLNTTYQRQSPATKRAVAAHEFMHALGFRHHGESGAVGRFVRSLAPAPSAGEWAALHAWYGAVA